MNEFEKKIYWSIRQYKLLPSAPSRVLVAVSGGADSIALLLALNNLGYECIAAHCNFHLRGEESNRDMAHVMDICQRFGIDMCLKHFNTIDYAAREGISIEMAAREQRYSWFERQVDRLKAVSVAVAHHSDDTIETFFLNLLRGTGIAGLTGIPRKRGIICRPMLDCTRKEAEDYLTSLGVTWVTDSSNRSNDYLRNRLRNIIIPSIEENFSGAKAAINTSISHLQSARRIYERAVEDKRRTYVSDNPLTIELAKLLRTEEEAQTLLFEWLRPYGFNLTQIRDIMASVDHSGAQFTAGSDTQGQYSLGIISRGQLLIETNSKIHPQEPTEYQVSLSNDVLTPIHISSSTHRVSQFRPQRDNNLACFDSNILHGNPTFQLRHWKKGDRMRPFGMEGTRLVSDIFSDAHYSLLDKQRTWLLTRNDVVIWIVGLRTSAHFQITPSTTTFLQLRYQP